MVHDTTKKETTRMRRLLMTLTALGLTAASLAFAAGAAGASSAAADCFTEPNNGDHWVGSSVGGQGYAEFWANDDYLSVYDERSNGRRTYVAFYICYDGSWGFHREYDSGPDEGDLDHESYDLHFREGRRIMFEVCEVTSAGALYKCGDFVHGHA
jgi:hypothetical protein